MDVLIRPAFQPVVSAHGETVLYEALMRFREAPDNAESRRSAIRRWEESGYIGTVDAAVLKQVLAAFELLPRSLLVSVNVSPVTLEAHRDRYLRHLSALASTRAGSLSRSRIRPRPPIRRSSRSLPSNAPRSVCTLASTIAYRMRRAVRKACCARCARGYSNSTATRFPTAFQARNGEALRKLSAMADSIGARAVAQGIDTRRRNSIGRRSRSAFATSRGSSSAIHGSFRLLDGDECSRSIRLHSQPAGSAVPRPSCQVGIAPGGRATRR